MIQKTKKLFIYYLGAFIALSLKYSAVNALNESRNMSPVYGIEEPGISLSWEKVISVILSPIIITMFVFIAMIIGAVLLIKGKIKNVKKDL